MIAFIREGIVQGCIVENTDHCHAFLLQFVQQGNDERDRTLIEGGGGFVEKEKTRFPNDRARHIDPLLLAAAECRRMGVEKIGGDLKPLQKLGGPSASFTLLAPVSRQ